MTDPLFYRWHCAMDQIAYDWQEAQGPHIESFKTPSVVIRKALGSDAPSNASPDIVIALRAAIPGADAPVFDYTAFGEATLGGANWDTAAPAGLNTQVLRTALRRDSLTEEDRQEFDDHFVYFIRLQNSPQTPTTVTVRIFLAAHELADQRRMWIEMDKFTHTLTPGQKAVVARPGWQSSVVRRKSVDPALDIPPSEESPADDEKGSDDAESSYCDCGLPYRLLVPRGRDAGMAFRFLVLPTDGDEDQVDPGKTCGSLSYCGRQTQTYPETKPMGYPFDRTSPAPVDGGDAIAAMIARSPTMATKDITIRSVPAASVG